MSRKVGLLISMSRKGLGLAQFRGRRLLMRFVNLKADMHMRATLAKF